MDRISVLAPAKINITLDILGRRSDGYHELRSIMQSVSVYDRLTITKTGRDGFEMTCSEPSVPCDERNLVIKAAKAFCEKHGITDGLLFELEKKIPSMAGMAGGSSDCAATLIGLDKMYSTEMTLSELIEIGQKLGADVPFCLAGGTQICEGIGEKLTKLGGMPHCYIVAVKPDLSISTPKAFAAYDSIENPKMSDFRGITEAFEKSDLDGICHRLFNALEYASSCEEIESIKERLISFGASASIMTGSGSAVYGIFKDKAVAEKCCGELSKDYSFAAVCEPTDFGCVIL